MEELEEWEKGGERCGNSPEIVQEAFFFSKKKKEVDPYS